MKHSFNFLIKKLQKECVNSKGYLGVDLDDIHGETEEEKIDVLFHRIMIEVMNLSETEYEYTLEYDDDAPFRSEYHVNLHIKRLIKFLKKYMSEHYIKERGNKIWTLIK